MHDHASPPSWHDELRRTNSFHARVVQTYSRRRDVRELRSKLLLLIGHFCCPASGRPRRRHYVPGAIVAFGIEGLLRAWWGFFGEAPPSERRLRAHVSVLERAHLIVRSPGNLLPGSRLGSDPRPREVDTIHVCSTPREADWWEEIGDARRAHEPKSKYSAAAWSRLFRRWREEAADPQLRFAFGEPAQNAPDRDDRPELALAAAELERGALLEDGIDMLAACRRAGADLAAKVHLDFATQRARLGCAMRALANRLRRHQRIRNRAGWIVWAFDYGPWNL